MEITMFLPWFGNVFAISHWLVLPCLYVPTASFPGFFRHSSQ
jgi:hypothetical protein